MKWLIILLMFVSETRYFGWNLSAKSDAEIICDLIILATAAIAFAAEHKTKGE